MEVSRKMACEIIVKNNWCQLYKKDKYFPSDMLDNTLSFFVEDYERTKAYKDGKWDGKRHLLYEKPYGYSFRTGLLNKVLLVLDVNTYPYRITEKRKFVTPVYVMYKWNFPHQLWEHQQTSFEEGMNKERGIFEIGMGGGKTILMAKLIHKIENSANCFVQRTIIARQNERVFTEVLGRCGFIGEGEFRPDKLNVIMLQTAYSAYIHTITVNKKVKPKDALPSTARIYKKELKKVREGKKWVEKIAYHIYRKGTEFDTYIYKTIRDIIEKANVSLFEEVHHLGASTYYFVSQKLNSRYIFGLSATPYRMHGDDLLIESGVAQKIVRYPIKYLIEHGILVRPEIELIELPYTYFSPQATWNQVYRDGIIANEERNKRAIKRTFELVTDEEMIGIVSVFRINHGKRLTSVLKEEGIKAEFLYGDTKPQERDVMLPDLKHRKLDVLVSNVLGEGFDLPELEFLIFAKGLGKDLPNKLSIMVIQEAGRLFRKCEGGKKTPILVDFVDRAKWLFDHFKARVRTYLSFGCKFTLPRGVRVD